MQKIWKFNEYLNNKIFKKEILYLYYINKYRYEYLYSNEINSKYKYFFSFLF